MFLSSESGDRLHTGRKAASSHRRSSSDGNNARDAG